MVDTCSISSRALTAISATVISKIVTMASYSAKVYVLNTASQGLKPTLMGLFTAYVTGGIVKGLDIVGKEKDVYKNKGIKGLKNYRYYGEI